MQWFQSMWAVWGCSYFDQPLAGRDETRPRRYYQRCFFPGPISLAVPTSGFALGVEQPLRLPLGTFCLYTNIDPTLYRNTGNMSMPECTCSSKFVWINSYVYWDICEWPEVGELKTATNKAKANIHIFTLRKASKAFICLLVYLQSSAFLITILCLFPNWWYKHVRASTCDWNKADPYFSNQTIESGKIINFIQWN